MKRIPLISMTIVIALCCSNNSAFAYKNKSYFSHQKKESRVSCVKLALKLLMCSAGGYAAFNGIQAVRADQNNYAGIAFIVGGGLVLTSFVPAVYDDLKILLNQDPPAVLFATIDAIVRKIGVAARLLGKLALGAFFVERAVDGMHANQWRAVKVIGNGIVAYKFLESANSDFNQIS
ncbi:MAG: hypothetical protein BWY54_00484 [Candidatus Dependentiae bacterium ADurb.Bin331]|nr:MAG: hypothetical protein BWY54_00484 [Candidatus Dependentiae bacterium ADurb.Bin331]